MVSGFWKAASILPYLRARATGRPTPVDVALHVTHRCNLDCAYCDRHHGDRSRELSPDELKKILTGFLVAGTRGVLFDGGEPLLRQDLLPIAEWLADRGVKVRLNTNGTLLPRRQAWFPHLSRIKVSIDGPRDVHDAMRGGGSFDRAWRGINLALDRGVKVELTCVLNHRNVCSTAGRPEPLRQLLDMAQEHGVRVTFQPARSSLTVGSGRKGNDFQASPGRLRRTLRFLIDSADHPAMGNRLASLRHFLRFPENTRIPCAAGWISCSVDPYGGLSPCPMLPARRNGPDLRRVLPHNAFAMLNRRGCLQCWCARQVEFNLAWGGRLWKFL